MAEECLRVVPWRAQPQDRLSRESVTDGNSFTVWGPGLWRLNEQASMTTHMERSDLPRLRLWAFAGTRGVARDRQRHDKQSSLQPLQKDRQAIWARNRDLVHR